jgi:hypothetical protein
VKDAVPLPGKQRRRDGLRGITGYLGTFITIGERISSVVEGIGSPSQSKNVVKCRNCLTLLKSVENCRRAS